MVGGNANIKATIQTILNTVLGFLGFIAVIVILIGGFMWMTAGGDEDKVGKAKKTLGAGIIGLAIILLAWLIVTIVYKVITGKGI